ncbi:MAG: DUF882 domain-containing protein, partial [Pseudomonadota bacterium]
FSQTIIGAVTDEAGEALIGAKGMAVDIQMRTRGARGIAKTARVLGAGGVGSYRTFAHVDSGPVRTWRR